MDLLPTGLLALAKFGSWQSAIRPELSQPELSQPELSRPELSQQDFRSMDFPETGSRQMAVPEADLSRMSLIGWTSARASWGC